MKKLYYDCPLIAGYMLTYFDVKFIDDNPKIGKEWLLGKILYYGSTFCIHPDSLPIFEPKSGDLVRLYNEDEGCHVIFRYYYSRKNGKILFSDHEEMDESCLEGIIQRNDKQFFMPMEE